MTLAEARTVLEQHRRRSRGRVREAIDVAITALPEEAPRMSAEERLTFIRQAIAERKGFDPFAIRSRRSDIAAWRCAVWKVMKDEGYRQAAIADLSGWDHSTVSYGVSRFKGYLACNDPITTPVWRELQEMISPPKPDKTT